MTFCVTWQNSSLHFYTLGKQKNIVNFKEFLILRCLIDGSLHTLVPWEIWRSTSKLCFTAFIKGRIFFSLFAFLNKEAV